MMSWKDSLPWLRKNDKNHGFMDSENFCVTFFQPVHQVAQVAGGYEQIACFFFLQKTFSFSGLSN